MDFLLHYSERRSIAIKIAGTEVHVYAPAAYGRTAAGQKAIADFISSKRRWIDRKLSEYKESADTMPGIKDFSAYYLDGKRIESIYDDSKSISYRNGRMHIPAALKDNRAALTTALKKFYTKTAKKRLAEKLDSVSARLALPYSGSRITNAKSKWGSCTADKKISLGWRLIILPEACQYYVIIHELCHTVQLNHSEKFWTLVGKNCADYKKLRKQLKSYAFLMEYLR